MATSSSSLSTINPNIYGLPGATPLSQARVRQLITRNHDEHHIFEANNIFHNHLAHHLLASFALGASPSLLDKIYDRDSKTLVPLLPEDRKKLGMKPKEVPEIDASNWKSFFGLQDAYASYLRFFSSEIKRLGPKEALALYVFSDDANGGKDKNANGPRMLIRMVAGVIHPFIQLGHGAEFSDPLLLAEGLAEAAVHNADTIGALFPSNWPHNSDPSDPLTGFSSSSTFSMESFPSSLTSAVSNLTTSDGPAKSRGLPALEIYAQLVSSAAITMKPYDPDALINARLRDALDGGNAEELRRLVSLWNLDTTSPGWETARSEELMLLGALLAGATGRKGKEIVIDFFLMHVLTSSIFVPSTLALLPSTEHKTVFLKTYLLAVLHTVLARGRPTIDAFLPMAHTSSPSKDIKTIEEGNPWSAIVEAVLFETDSHTPKSIRTLLHLTSQPKFALASAGRLPHAANSSIKGMETVDGTIFVRIAGMIMQLIAGWGEGKGQRGDWGRIPPGWDEAWEEVKDVEGK